MTRPTVICRDCAAPFEGSRAGVTVRCPACRAGAADKAAARRAAAAATAHDDPTTVETAAKRGAYEARRTYGVKAPETVEAVAAWRAIYDARMVKAHAARATARRAA